MRRSWLATLFGAALAASALTHQARATPYDAIYVFGDSLSDNGNLAEVYPPGNTTGFPNPPSYHQSFTNGPVAVSDLAAGLGLPLNPSLWLSGFADVKGLFPGVAPGTNYAVAGATSNALATGGPSSINLPQQVLAYNFASHGVADSNALYVVMIGGNDVRNATLQTAGSSQTPAAASSIATGVQTELAAISTLAGIGARQFLVVNVPDVGVIPEFAQDDPSQASLATQLTRLYNSELSAGLAGLPVPASTSLSLFDLFSYNGNIDANAAAYGLTDTTDACYTNTPVSAATSPQCGPNAQNIGSFVYWDSIHPTAQVHALWAQGMEATLGVSVPEPSTLVLLPLAAALAMLRPRRRRMEGEQAL
ncbi:MAG: SGNH/GDSL hydrolase family protein [Acetobacteraceae bacterium]|nr:SGNH/GDSL hydrolase family protein [Acetobacteraceae bacterium]